MKQLSYSTFITLKEGAYQIVSNEAQSFALYIDDSKKLNLLFISDIPFLSNQQKKISLHNDNNQCSIRLSDIDLNLNDIFIRYNLTNIQDVLEEKEVVNTVHTIDISNVNYSILDTLLSENSEVNLYFYQLTDISKFNEHFLKEFKKIIEDADVPDDNDLELDMVFKISNLNYFDVFPIYEKFKDKSGDMNIINGCKLNKINLTVKK